MYRNQITYTESGIYVFVERSLLSKMDSVLSTIEDASGSNMWRGSGVFVMMGVRELRNRIYENVKVNDDLYVRKNMGLVIDIHNILKYRESWEPDFISDYACFWDENERRFPISEIDLFLYEINNIVNELNEIVRLGYQKLKQENREFAEDLAKYVFKPQRLMRFGKQYGFESFVEYLDILDPL